MVYFGILISFVFSALILLANGKGTDELKAVVVLFRHGDRSPVSSWPTDVYFKNASLWPDGYGELNLAGKERHYRLGQWFRKRYDGFLPKRYNRSDIYVRSTDVDRTLMSAASNLAGLYPPEGDQVLDPKVRWQPIPIHTVPKSQDAILASKINCPKYTELLKKLDTSKELRSINKKYAKLYKDIAKFSGFSSVDIKKISKIVTTATIYKGYKFTLPKWIETNWAQMSELAAISSRLSTYTPALARFRVGPFYDYLLTYLQEVKNHTVDTTVPKFLMLSAHAATVASRTNAMGVYPNAKPEFGSTVIWELRSNGNNYYVNMYFKNSTSLTKLILPKCKFDCELNNFASLLKPITATAEQLKKECNK